MRQNLTIVLLSVIATLLVVVVIQNSINNSIMAQTGGSSGATVGPIGVATGSLQGADAAGFWIYDPESRRVMVYDYARNQLRLKSVRNVQYDMTAVDFNLSGQKGPSVAEMKRATSKKRKK